MSARPPRELVVVGVAATVLTLVGGVAAEAATSADSAEPPSTTTTSSTTTSSSTTTTTAAPTTTTTTAPVDPVEAAIQRWFPDVEERASAIAWCESTHNPRAVSPGGGNHGLFQINNVHRGDWVAVTGTSWAEG